MTTRAEYEARRDAVAARITADPQLFDMAHWGRKTECGTVCCIAGHTVLEAGLPIVWIVTSHGPKMSAWLDDRSLIEHAAAEYLGIPLNVARGLFFSDAPHQDPESAALALKQAPYVVS